MQFSSLTQRIGGESADVWQVHYEAAARLRAGDDIILLSVGQENNEVTPEPIQQAAISSIANGRHHYTPVAGESRLRQMIAERHYSHAGQAVEESNICVFAGAQNALFASAQCLLESGDEVIVLEPYYATYPATFTATGARLVPVPVYPEDSFQPDPTLIKQAITPATRVLVLNSPNNPTGAIYQRECLQVLIDLCVERNIWIISDEVYAELAEPDSYTSVCSLPKAGAITITIGSLSKSHRMTGWRCGWAVAPKALIKHFYNLCLCMSYGLPSFIQDAAERALQDDIEITTQLRATLERRYQVLIEELAPIQNITLYGNPGGMFAILDIRALAVDGICFAKTLLERGNVSVLPCDGFGASGRGLLRMSLCEHEDRLRLACHQLKKIISHFTSD